MHIFKLAFSQSGTFSLQNFGLFSSFQASRKRMSTETATPRSPKKRAKKEEPEYAASPASKNEGTTSPNHSGGVKSSRVAKGGVRKIPDKDACSPVRKTVKSPVKRAVKSPVKRAVKSPVKRTLESPTKQKTDETARARRKNTRGDKTSNNGTANGERVVHRRPRRKNVFTRDFAQSP